MENRSEALAREFEAANATVIDLVQNMAPEDWRKVSDAEGWSVGVVLHHLAVSYPATVAVARAAVDGNAPPVTAQLLDERNAEHAREYAGCTPEETLDLLQENGETAVAAIRAFTDQDLDSNIALPLFGDDPVSVEQILRFGLTMHIDEHLGSVRRTLAR